MGAEKLVAVTTFVVILLRKRLNEEGCGQLPHHGGPAGLLCSIHPAGEGTWGSERSSDATTHMAQRQMVGNRCGMRSRGREHSEDAEGPTPVMMRVHRRTLVSACCHC